MQTGIPAGEAAIVAPSPLVGEGCPAVQHEEWVRGYSLVTDQYPSPSRVC